MATEPVVVTEGEYTNIKLTTPDDIVIAENRSAADLKNACLNHTVLAVGRRGKQLWLALSGDRALLLARRRDGRGDPLDLVAAQVVLDLVLDLAPAHEHLVHLGRDEPLLRELDLRVRVAPEAQPLRTVRRVAPRGALALVPACDAPFDSVSSRSAMRRRVTS